MKTIYSCNGNFRIGRVGENDACEVMIAKEGFAEVYGAGVYTLVYERPDGETYECSVEERERYIVWTPTAADTAVQGRGHVELVYRAGEVVAKGNIYDVIIDTSLPATGEAPTVEPEVFVFPTAQAVDGARLARVCQKTIYIGRVGENRATVASVRKGPEMASYEGAFGLLFQRPGEVTPYLVEAVDKGEYLEWIVTNTDTAIAGRGKLQMIYSNDGVVAKGDIYDTMCDISLDGPGEPPEPWQGWIEEVLEAAAKVENMTASASVTSAGETGVVVTKTETADSYNLDFAFTGIGAEAVLEMNINSLLFDVDGNKWLFVAENVSSLEDLAALNPTLVRLHYDGWLVFNPPYSKSITGTVRRNAEDWSSYTIDFGEFGRVNNSGTRSVEIPTAMLTRMSATNADALTLRAWEQVFSAETQAQMRTNINAASETDLTTHTGNDNIHVTAADKNIWDAKYNKPVDGIPASDMTQAVQDALTNAETIVECVYNDTIGASYQIKSLNTSEELKELNPTLMRFKWNHSDPTNTTSFDRYAVATVKRYNLSVGIGFALDFGEYGCYLAAAASLSMPVLWTLPISKFEDYFDSTATTSAVRVWSQTFNDEKKAQARTNIGAASEGDLTAHTGDTDIHVTAQDKIDWSAKYDLPANGIPDSDLAQAVQNDIEAGANVVLYATTADVTANPVVFTLNKTLEELYALTEQSFAVVKFVYQRTVLGVALDYSVTALLKIIKITNGGIIAVDFGDGGVIFSGAILNSDVPTISMSHDRFLKLYDFDGKDFTLHTWAQSFNTAEQDQMRANIGAAAASDIPTQTSDLTNNGADGTSTYVEADELATVATSGLYSDLSGTPTIPTDYIHDGNYTTAQYRKGGLVIGAANASEAGGVNVTNGRIYVTGVSNPLFGLKSSDTGATQFFLQVTKDKLYVGPTSTMALDFNGADGKVVMPNDVTVKGKIIKNGGTSSQFLKADGSVDSTTYSTFDGDYNSLTNKPTIPTNTSDLANDGSDGTSVYVEADELATVATTGAYSDLTGTPTIHDVPAGGNAGQVLKKNSATDYDVHWASETDIYPSGYCTTAGGTATKVVNCSLWTATADTYLHILLAQPNTAAEAISMRINASAAIPVYINGEPSSATNYTLPAGTYLAFYDGTNIHLRTDGQLPGNIVGEAAATETKLLTKADSVGATANYAAKLTASIPYGECDSTSTSTAFKATVPGITELKDGVCMLLYNGVVTSASGFTINVNGLGAKPSYNNMTLGNPVTPTSPTRDTTIFNINYAFLFVYSETLVSGGCWIGYRGYDANTNTIGYQLRTNNTTMKTTDKFYRYRLLFTSADGTKWVPANTSTSTNATAARTPNTRAIDPFGEIVWYGTTTAIEANANVTAGQLWQEYYGSYTAIGYSFNNTGAAQTMTANKAIYIKCTPQADGSAVIDPTTPYVQDLPTTADGKIYIYLGRAYNATNFEILMNHPVYYHDGSGIRMWTGKAVPDGLPAVTSADNGKVLQVVNGVWTPTAIPSANGVNF